MPTFIQTIMSALPAGTVAKFAGFLGETPQATTSALAKATPALLAGAFERSSTTAGANDLLGMVKQVTAGGNPLDRIDSILSDEGTRRAYLSQGQSLAGSLLGGHSAAVASTIHDSARIAGGSASTILAFLAPMVLGALGRASGSTPTATGLQSWLASERGSVLRTLPAGLDALFGLGAPVPAQSAMNRFLPWILGGLTVALLLFGMRNCMPLRNNLTTAAVTLNLPGGGSINVLPGSLGFGVARFLESSDPPPKTFVFDSLNFDTASNALTPESLPTVGVLVPILKAYPRTEVRIVGYTDNQGDPAANKSLSESRAVTVKQGLVNGGIAEGRIATEGMGEADPVADNATEEGRAKNRRTELVIVKK